MRTRRIRPFHVQLGTISAILLLFAGCYDGSEAQLLEDELEAESQVGEPEEAAAWHATEAGEDVDRRPSAEERSFKARAILTNCIVWDPGPPTVDRECVESAIIVEPADLDLLLQGMKRSGELPQDVHWEP